MMSLQQVQSTYSPLVDTELQEYLEGVGERVLDSWPVSLKGYRYRFKVVDSDDVNAFAVTTGYIFITRGLLQSLESDNEVAAILAHEIATWRATRDRKLSPVRVRHPSKKGRGNGDAQKYLGTHGFQRDVERISYIRRKTRYCDEL